MKTRLLTLIATIAAISTAASVASQAVARGDGRTCHGKAATYVGTNGDDRLTKQQVDLGNDPVLVLRGGDDRVAFRAREVSGRAIVCGGSGDDLLTVGSTSSQVETLLADGGSGMDRLGDDTDVDNSGVGPMKLIGGGGDDELLGADFADRISGGSGNDLILGLDGDDRLAGGSGDDDLFGHGGRDRADGGEGADSCENVEVVSGCESG